MGEQIFSLAFGVLVAGVAQAGFQLPYLMREGYRPRWVTPWRNDSVREVVRKMIPATIGVAAFQFNIIITQTLAFWIERSTGSKIVASFEYAVRLMELPQGVFGVSLATFLLPTLAGLAAEKKFPEFRENLQRGMGYLFFVNAIAAAMLIVLAEPMVRLLFEHGKGAMAEVAVYEDASGEAWDPMMAVAMGIGATQGWGLRVVVSGRDRAGSIRRTSSLGWLRCMDTGVFQSRS